MEGLSSRIRARLLARIEEMSNDLKGDVKRLTSFTPEYRLRVGDDRVLFEIEEEKNRYLSDSASARSVPMNGGSYHGYFACPDH
jgi:hypothetical protein